MSDFWNGFEKASTLEKQAVSPATADKLMFALAGGMSGAAAGSTIAGLLANHKARKIMESWKESPDKRPSKETFEALKDSVPDTVLVTPDEIAALKEEANFLQKHLTIKQLEGLINEGNAFAVHPSLIGPIQKYMLPKSLRGKKFVGAGKDVLPSVISHELGHIVDFDEAAKKKGWEKFKAGFRGRMAEEVAAWDKAPGEIDPKVREDALGTYRRATTYPLAGLGAGALLGALGGFVYPSLVRL